MQFTEADKQLLAKVKRKHHAWLKWRRALLTVYALGTILGLGMFIAVCLALIGALNLPDMKACLKVVAIAAVWAPFSLAICVPCATGLGLVIGMWNIPSRELLIRLAEEHENHKN
jgi:hypothetical protein